MSEKISRTCRKSLQSQAERMRAAKAARRHEQQSHPSSSTPGMSSSTPGTSFLNESLILPGPITGEDSDVESSDESDYEVTFGREEATAIFRDWKDKMMALMLHDNFMERFGLVSTAAAREVGILLGVNEKTVRLWRKDFYTNKGEFSEYLRGKHARYAVLDDEEYCKMALEWIRSHAYAKGKPNLRARHFCDWIN